MNIHNNVGKSAFNYNLIKILFTQIYSEIKGNGIKCLCNNQSNQRKSIMTGLNTYQLISSNIKSTLNSNLNMSENNKSVNTFFENPIKKTNSDGKNTFNHNQSTVNKELIYENEIFTYSSCILSKILRIKIN